MKYIILCVLVLLAACEAESLQANNTLCFSVNWQIGILAGIEHQFNQRIGFKGDLGASIFGHALADALLTVNILPERYRWQLAFCAGVPNASATPATKEGMVSLGADIHTRFKATQRMNIDFRIGTGQPFFFKKNSDIIRDINFPLGLWPNFAVGVSFALHR